MFDLHRTFWQEHPALAFGLSSLLGAFVFLEHVFWIALLWLAYWLILRCWSKAFLQTSMCCCIALHAHLQYHSLPEPKDGQAHFSIHSVQPHSSPFQKGWLYKGTLHTFQQDSCALPCAIIYRGASTERPQANCDYLVEGTLKQNEPWEYAFKATSWQPIQNTWSLAEWRHRAKTAIRTLLDQQIKEPSATAFLTALFTGEIEDRHLRFEFGRIGLQHILAISGFHFAILGAFVSFIASQILSMRMRIWTLLTAVSLYFFFVGNSPPVQRSFLAASLFLIGQLLGRSSSGLNLLGFCMLFEVIIDPLVVRNLGFQLSFLSCFGILLFNTPLQRLFTPLFPERSLPQAAGLPLSSQAAFLLTSFTSRALYLTLAVNLALFPLLLYHFHRFPYLSLLYNLFIPQLTAAALFLLLLALTLYCIYPLFSLPVFKALDFLTGQILELVSTPPAPLDYSLSLALPGWAIALYLSLFLLSGIQIRTKQ